MAKNANKQVAFLFGEGGTSKDKLGGKGAGLAELIEAGLPVPLGFTLTTSVARAFAQHNAVPKRLRHQITWGFAAMEKASGKRFGDAANPLLVSVRSGAKVSMPGMMDTVLNLGINPEIAAGLAQKTSKLFAYDCYRRFLSMFGEVVQGISKDVFKAIVAEVKQARGVVKDQELSGDDWHMVCNLMREAVVAQGKPLVDDPQVQLTMAVDAVLESWNSPRAKEYRAAKGIQENLGTAVNIQTMVYGNRDDDSATGVAFSRNTATGVVGLTVEFLVRAQGEDVVAGVRTPAPLSAMAAWNAEVAVALEKIVLGLEAHYGFVVDVEFTVESGVLYILQVRAAKLAPLAAVTAAVHAVWAGQAKEVAVARVTGEQLESVLAPAFAANALKANTAIASGLVACPGAIVGRVVLTCEEAIAASKRGESVVLVREDTSPDDLPGMLVAAAIVTKTGGFTCHAAVVARDLGKPCIVGCGEGADRLRAGTVISVDANAGCVYSGSLKLVEPVKTKEVNLFGKWHAVEQAKKIPPARLVFEYVNRSIQVSQMLNDFYLADSMAAAARGTSLAGEATNLRTKVHVEVAERLAMYLTVAVGGEIRHAQASWMREQEYGGYSGYGGYNNPGHRLPSLRSGDSNLKALIDEFRVELDGNDREGAQVVHTNRLKAMTHAQHVRFLDLCAKVFNNGRWNGSMGGRPWGQIAEAAHDFLAGKTSHTGFADHAFDLQHNNGTVFGKNSMLSGSRSEIQSRLDRKKHAHGTVDLYRTLAPKPKPAPRYGYGWGDRDASQELEGVGFSPEVEALYRKGERANLWK